MAGEKIDGKGTRDAPTGRCPNGSRSAGPRRTRPRREGRRACPSGAAGHPPRRHRWRTMAPDWSRRGPGWGGGPASSASSGRGQVAGEPDQGRGDGQGCPRRTGSAPSAAGASFGALRRGRAGAFHAPAGRGRRGGSANRGAGARGNMVRATLPGRDQGSEKGRGMAKAANAGHARGGRYCRPTRVRLSQSAGLFATWICWPMTASAGACTCTTRRAIMTKPAVWLGQYDPGRLPVRRHAVSRW